ncbi:MAG: ERF family protein [Leptotrichia hongkongensis]
MNIYEKINKIQVELKAPKSQRNNFGNYNFRNCEDILEALKPLLLRGKMIIQLSDELVQIGDRFYIKATATLIDTESGEKHSTTSFAREELTKKGMDGSQITGASSSYARKYALNGLLAIDDTKDSDTTNIGNQNNNTKQTKSAKSKMTPEEEQEKKEKCIKWIVDNISKVEENKQVDVLNNLDLLDLDNLELKELKIIYKNISKELEKGA